MISLNLAIILGCITIVSSLLGAIWTVATYKNGLDARIAQNTDAIKRLRKDCKFAYKNIEASHSALQADVFDIQGFLLKTTKDPQFQIRGRTEIPSNSGADFLEDLNNQ